MPDLTCPNGHPVDPEAPFCATCGEAVSKCPNGHAVAAASSFCGDCGAPTAPTPAEPSDQPSRRWVPWAIGSTALAALVIGLLLFQGDDGAQTPTAAIATSSTTTEPTTTTTTTPSTTTIVATPELSLLPDGLGAVSVGDPTDEVMATMTDILGPAADDFIEPNCLGATARFVRWGALTLVLWVDDNPRLGRYGVGRQGEINTALPNNVELRTTDGIAVGSTLADLRATYGSELIIEDLVPGFIWFASSADTDNRITGSLNGLDDDAQVETIGAGDGLCSE